MLNDLRNFVKSEPWDFSFLDGPSTAFLNGPSTAFLDSPSTAFLDGPTTAFLDSPNTAFLNGSSTAFLDGTSTTFLDGTSTALLDGPTTTFLEGPTTTFLDGPSTDESWGVLTMNNGLQNISSGLQNINNGQQSINNGQQHIDLLRAPSEKTTQPLNSSGQKHRKGTSRESEPWDWSFFDDESTTAQSWGAPTINNKQQDIGALRAPMIMKGPQLPKPANQKRKRSTSPYSEPLDLSLRDSQGIDPQSWEFLTMINGQQDFEIPKAPAEKLPQLLQPSGLKRKRSTSRSPSQSLSQKRPFRQNPGQLPTIKGAPVVVYDAKGHKRGARVMNTLHRFRVESEDNGKYQRSEADNERARKTLSILAGKIAILRYACGCKSPQGICNHHSFSGGLNLPDGVICHACRNGAAPTRVSQARHRG